MANDQDELDGLHKYMWAVMNQALTPLEESLMYLLYKPEPGHKQQDYEEVAAILSMTPAKVREIEKRCFAKILKFMTKREQSRNPNRTQAHHDFMFVYAQLKSYTPPYTWPEKDSARAIDRVTLYLITWAQENGIKIELPEGWQP